MCGRFVLRSPLPAIAAAFGVAEQEPDALGARPLAPRYNVAPGTPVLAVGLRDGRRALRTLQWGLVPSWAADPSIGNRLVNARAEGVEKKPSFRAAIRKRRVLVPADGWYEWAPARPGERAKRPHFFSRSDGAMVALAGLWEFWRPRDTEAHGDAHDRGRATAGTNGDPSTHAAGDPAGDPAAGAGLRTACLLTTEPNRVAAEVHDRMPVTIAEPDWDAWLDPATPLPRVLEMLRPAPEGSVRAWPVSSAVSRVANDGPELIEPWQAAPNSA